MSTLIGVVLCDALGRLAVCRVRMSVVARASCGTLCVCLLAPPKLPTYSTPASGLISLLAAVVVVWAASSIPANLARPGSAMHRTTRSRSIALVSAGRICLATKEIARDRTRRPSRPTWLRMGLHPSAWTPVATGGSTTSQASCTSPCSPAVLLYYAASHTGARTYSIEGAVTSRVGL